MSRQSILCCEYSVEGAALILSDTRNYQAVLFGTIVTESAPDQFARPTSDISAGIWTPSTGTDLYATIDEVTPDDADYDTATNPSASAFEVKLGTITDPAQSTEHVIRYRVAGISGAVDWTVALRQGASTQITSWTHSGVTTATTFTELLTAAETDSITDYSDLRLRFTATKV